MAQTIFHNPLYGGQKCSLHTFFRWPKNVHTYLRGPKLSTNFQRWSKSFHTFLDVQASFLMKWVILFRSHYIFKGSKIFFSKVAQTVVSDLLTSPLGTSSPGLDPNTLLDALVEHIKEGLINKYAILINWLYVILINWSTSMSS